MVWYPAIFRAVLKPYFRDWRKRQRSTRDTVKRAAERNDRGSDR